MIHDDVCIPTPPWSNSSCGGQSRQASHDPHRLGRDTNGTPVRVPLVEWTFSKRTARWSFVANNSTSLQFGSWKAPGGFVGAPTAIPNPSAPTRIPSIRPPTPRTGSVGRGGDLDRKMVDRRTGPAAIDPSMEAGGGGDRAASHSNDDDDDDCSSPRLLFEMPACREAAIAVAIVLVVIRERERRRQRQIERRRGRR